MAENDREMKEIKSPVIEKLEAVENAVDLVDIAFNYLLSLVDLIK